MRMSQIEPLRTGAMSAHCGRCSISSQGCDLRRADRSDLDPRQTISGHGRGRGASSPRVCPRHDVAVAGPARRGKHGDPCRSHLLVCSAISSDVPSDPRSASTRSDLPDRSGSRVCADDNPLSGNDLGPTPSGHPALKRILTNRCNPDFSISILWASVRPGHMRTPRQTTSVQAPLL